MKKKLLCCCIFLFLILIINIPSFATIDISKVNIMAEVLSNGDMKVVETIQYYSDEQDRGIIRNISTVNSTSAINSAYGMTLKSVSVDNQKYSRSEYEKIGTYKYNISPEGHEIKIYPPYYKTEYVIKYEYLLHNVAVEYDYTAEVFWNFIENFSYDINKLNIEMFLPNDSINNYPIEVSPNGLEDLYIQKDWGKVVLQAQNVQAYELVGAKVLFSQNSVNNLKKFVSSDLIDNVLIEEITSEESEQVIFGLSVGEIAVVLDIVLIIVMISSYIIFDKEEKVENIKYFEKLPYNLNPELLQYIYCGKAKSNAFYIGVLNLIKLGVYKLEKTVNIDGKESQKLVFLTENVNFLKQYQLDMIKTINGCLDIDETGRKSADLEVLESRLTVLGKEGFKDFERSLKTEKEKLAGKVAKAPKKVVLASTFAMISLIIFIIMMATAVCDFEEVSGLAFILGFTTFVYSLAFSSLGSAPSTWIFMILHAGCFQIANIMLMWECDVLALYPTYLLMFIYIQYLVRIKKYPVEERQVISYLKGLKRYIRDFPMNRCEDIPLWEDYLMIAIAFGFNSKTINYFYNYGKQQNSNLSVSLRNTSTYTKFNYMMHTTFNLHRKSNGKANYSPVKNDYSTLNVESTYFQTAVENKDDENCL